MPDLRLNITYTVVLTAQELRVVLSSLKGTLPTAWKAEAEALQDKMWNSRNQQVAGFAKTIERMAKGAEEDADAGPAS